MSLKVNYPKNIEELIDSIERVQKALEVIQELPKTEENNKQFDSILLSITPHIGTLSLWCSIVAPVTTKDQSKYVEVNLDAIIQQYVLGKDQSYQQIILVKDQS